MDFVVVLERPFSATNGILPRTLCSGDTEFLLFILLCVVHYPAGRRRLPLSTADAWRLARRATAAGDGSVGQGCPLTQPGRGLALARRPVGVVIDRMMG